MENLYTTKALKKIYNQSGIYMIQIGNRYYVGSSISIGARLSTHKSRLKRGKHENIIMINCFNKYGENQCYFKVLEYCDSDQLILREKFYIDVLKPELNIELNPVLQNSNYKSKVVYQYTLKGMYVRKFSSASEAERYNNKLSSKISQCCLNKRKSAYGYLWSYDKVENLIYTNNSSKAKAKCVTQYNLENVFLNHFESLADAIRILGLPGKFDSCCTNISACCLGKTKKAYGYIWKYESGMGT
jgi:group I intron endonuclease